MIDLQPFRIPSGWIIDWNTFPEVDPSPETISEFQGSSLLMLHHPSAHRMMDVCWRPELDPDGQFQLVVCNRLEVFNAKDNSFSAEVHWEQPVLEFSSRSRAETVAKIEALLRTMKPYEDPRILKRRGEVDQPSESLRLQLEEDGFSAGLAQEIIGKGNAKLQDLLIDHPDIDRATLVLMVKDGIKKGVRKKALQKLNSRKFR